MRVILETERLVLREYGEEDAESFFRLNSDPAVIEFTNDALVPSVEKARDSAGVSDGGLSDVWFWALGLRPARER